MSLSKYTITSVDDLLDVCNSTYKETGSLQLLYNQSSLCIDIDYSGYISFSGTSYKRNLIVSSPYVDVYLICWRGGQSSKIHDHPERGCIMYVLEGELEENIYNLSNSNDNLNNNANDHNGGMLVSYSHKRKLGAGDTSYNFGSKVLHQIIANRDTVSLHIYHVGYVPKFYTVPPIPP
jgi:hypothetical protein